MKSAASLLNIFPASRGLRVSDRQSPAERGPRGGDGKVHLKENVFINLIINPGLCEDASTNATLDQSLMFQ